MERFRRNMVLQIVFSTVLCMAMVVGPLPAQALAQIVEEANIISRTSEGDDLIPVSDSLGEDAPPGDNNSAENDSGSSGGGNAQVENGSNDASQDDEDSTATVSGNDDDSTATVSSNDDAQNASMTEKETDQSDETNEDKTTLLPTHGDITGNLPVFVSFTLDGKKADSQAIIVGLQQRTRTWDPDAKEWTKTWLDAVELDAGETDFDAGWKDAVDEKTQKPIAVYLAGEEIAAAVKASDADDDVTNGGPAYLFENLPIQITCEDGSYDTRIEYRAVVTSVDGTAEDIDYSNVTFEYGDVSKRTQTYVVDAQDTKAKTVAYTVEVSTDAALAAMGSTSETDEAVATKLVVKVKGKTLPEEEATPKRGVRETDDGRATDASGDGKSVDENTVVADLPAKVAFQKDGEDRAALASVQVAEIANELSARKAMFARMLGLFGQGVGSTGETTLAGTKTIVGREFQAGDEWTFTVTAPAGTPMPEHQSVTIRPTGGASADINFGTITYTQQDFGEVAPAADGTRTRSFTYTITETGTANNVTNDTAKTVTVSVEDKGDGTLELTNSSEDDDTPLVFRNVYHAGGKTTLSGTKTIEGREFQAGDEWTFTVTADDSAAPMPEHESVTIRPTGGASADINFGTITYTQQDFGEVVPAADGTRTRSFTYTITETGSATHVANDTPKTVTITASDDGDGNITTLNGTSETPLVFNNMYQAEGRTTLAGTKAISGREFQRGDEWTFTVTALAGTPMPEHGSVTVEPTGGDSTPIDFGDIRYTEADAGKTYTYTITETGEVAGVTNDTAKTVTVSVEDKGDGTLELTNSSEDDDTPLVFRNVYHAGGKTTLSGTKTIEGREFQAGDEWTFTVTADDSAAPMPEHESVTVRPTGGDSTPIDFGTIAYTEADAGKTYTYTITETGEVAGVTNDTPKTVTVNVADNSDGTLAVTTDKTDSELTFVNVYTAPTANVSVTKVWVDSTGKALKWPEGATVTVELLKDGKQMEPSRILELTAGQTTGTFAGLDASELGTYTVSEAKVEGAGLDFKATYTGSAEKGYTITNTYNASEETHKEQESTSTTHSTGLTSSATTSQGGSRSLARTGDDTSLAVPAVIAMFGGALVAYGLHLRLRRRDI